MCGRDPFSICERYDWLIVVVFFPFFAALLRPLATSSCMARTISSCVMGRPRPRSDPSTSLRYRIFSPSLIVTISDRHIYIANCNICQEVDVLTGQWDRGGLGCSLFECRGGRPRPPRGAKATRPDGIRHIRRRHF